MAAGKFFGFKNTSHKHTRSSIQSSIEISAIHSYKRAGIAIFSLHVLNRIKSVLQAREKAKSILKNLPPSLNRDDGGLLH